MRPPIPQKLLRVDESTLEQHFLLRRADACFYVWEYTAGQRYDFSPTNQLIANLKIKPSAITQSPLRDRYKQLAIEHTAAGLRHLLSRAYVEEHATFVPVPGSKASGDPDYDPRMLRVLQQALHGWSADIRPLLALTRSTPADHETAERLAYDELRTITQVHDESGQALRPVVVIVDDVLNSGKHFKVAQALVAANAPGVEIRGLFIARCVHNALDRRSDERTPSDGEQL